MTTPLLVSKRKAARLLGCDRGTTLEELIRAGKLGVVVFGGRPRIPVADINRVVAEATYLKPRAVTAPRRGRFDAEAEYAKVMAIKLAR